jgi:hypothetical protein
MENAGSGKNDSVWAICVHYFYWLENGRTGRIRKRYRVPVLCCYAEKVHASFSNERGSIHCRLGNEVSGVILGEFPPPGIVLAALLAELSVVVSYM